MDYTRSELPKGRTRKQLKSRSQRTEAKVKKAVRTACVERDGECLVATRAGVFGECGGVPEWAHFAGHRRSQTRGMAPERRHDTRFTGMLCTKHHKLEEDDVYRVVYLTLHGADGPVMWSDARLEYPGIDEMCGDEDSY